MISNQVLNYIKLYDLLKLEDSINSKFINHQKILCKHHYQHNKHYKKIIDDIFGFNSISKEDIFLKNMPFLPVRLFKDYDLYTSNPEDIFKILKSSGTTSNKVSKIFLDRDNTKNQTMSLSKIFTDFSRLTRPGMLIADTEATIANKKSFSARAAGIIGFSYLSRKPIFALNSEMDLILNNIENILSNNENNEILIFGFTYIIWLHLLKNKLPKELRIELGKKAILLHGGGWKKLESQNISKEQFKQKVQEYIGIEKSINYYGMVEQTGSIFMECEKGYLHTNPLCGIISRNKKTLDESKIGDIGIAQVISSIPTSYPGNSILTDDLIRIHGKDDCKCGRKGVYFDILGRLKNSDPRGCSDTYKH